MFLFCCEKIMIKEVKNDEKRRFRYMIPMLAILAIKFVLPFVLAGLALIVLAIAIIGFSTTQVGILVLQILSSKLLYILLGGWFAVKFVLFQMKIKRNRR